MLSAIDHDRAGNGIPLILPLRMIKALRLYLQGTPLSLPLLAVVGSIAASWWYAIPVLSILLALAFRMWRVSICTALCALVTCLHTHMVHQRELAFCQDAEMQEVVELTGTVERELRRGCVLSTGWNGVRVILRGDLPYTVGDVVRVRAQWQPPTQSPLRGIFSPHSWMRSIGASAILHVVDCEKIGKPFSLRVVQYWGLRMRERLSRILMPPGSESDAARQVLCALVLGDKSGAEAVTMEGFRNGGCLHAFAVSGLHVGLVSGILWLLLRMLRVRPVVIRPLVLLMTGVYVLMTGCAVPAIRAYVMLSVVLLGYILQRKVSLLNTWSFAALLILLVDSSQLFNAGFLLSVGVYAALCLSLKICLEEKAWFGPDDYIPPSLRTPWEMRWSNAELAIRGAVIVSLSAWLVSVPITLYFFHSANTVSFLTNISITPILPVVMFCGLLQLCLSGVPWVGPAITCAAQKSAAILLAVVTWFGDLPYAYLPAQEPAPLHSLMVQGTGFGGSFTILGNHGLLIDCGSEVNAELKTVPTLFHAGYTPAALLLTSPRVSAGGGAGVVQRMWKHIPVIEAHELPPEGKVFETQAGRFTIYPAPADFAHTSTVNHHPLVLWETMGKRVLYIGHASYCAFSTIPADNADIALLGRHPHQPVEPSDVRTSRIILLPGCQQQETGIQGIPVGENENMQLRISELK